MIKKIREKINGNMKISVVVGCSVVLVGSIIAFASNLNSKVNDNTTGRKVNESKIEGMANNIKEIKGDVKILLGRR